MKITKGQLRQLIREYAEGSKEQQDYLDRANQKIKDAHQNLESVATKLEALGFNVIRDPEKPYQIGLQLEFAPLQGKFLYSFGAPKPGSDPKDGDLQYAISDDPVWITYSPG